MTNFIYLLETTKHLYVMERANNKWKLDQISICHHFDMQEKLFSSL